MTPISINKTKNNTQNKFHGFSEAFSEISVKFQGFLGSKKKNPGFPKSRHFKTCYQV